LASNKREVIYSIFQPKIGRGYSLLDTIDTCCNFFSDIHQVLWRGDALLTKPRQLKHVCTSPCNVLSFTVPSGAQFHSWRFWFCGTISEYFTLGVTNEIHVTTLHEAPRSWHWVKPGCIHQSYVLVLGVKLGNSLAIHGLEKWENPQI
jgi:hypothetical protein